MKIVVIGGSGLIGKKLIPILRGWGHEAVSASPSSGVNTPLATSTRIKGSALTGSAAEVPAVPESVGELVFSTPQILFTNLQTASAMLNALFLFLCRALHYSELYFDLAAWERAQDPRPGRYWALMAVINGWPDRPDPMPAWRWILKTTRVASITACSLGSAASQSGTG